jgi:hypothetical protein
VADVPPFPPSFPLSRPQILGAPSFASFYRSVGDHEPRPASVGTPTSMEGESPHRSARPSPTTPRFPNCSRFTVDPEMEWPHPRHFRAFFLARAGLRQLAPPQVVVADNYHVRAHNRNMSSSHAAGRICQRCARSVRKRKATPTPGGCVLLLFAFRSNQCGYLY